MNIGDWLASATKKLEASGISTARLDALVLLEDILAQDRSYLLAHENDVLPLTMIKKLQKQIERRENHEPLAYIRGKSEFYGREFMVNKHTLQPRPETETMIDLLKSHFPFLLQDSLVTDEENVNWRIVDVGAGSGCIGITAKLEVPEIEVVGIDISKECLEIAKQNSKKLGADVTFYQGNLLEPVKNAQTDILLCNLPYVPDSHTINQAAMQEPKLAIFGGADGLDLYRQLFEQIKRFKLNPQFILTESLPFQHEELAKIALSCGYEQRKEDDFIQLFSLPEQLLA